MSKYYYLAIGGVVVLLIIALTVLSRIDKTILDPSRKSSESVSALQQSEQPYHSLSSSKKDDSAAPSLTPYTKPRKDKATSAVASLNLRLIGTTVFGEKSTVIIEDLTKGTRGVYRLGDIIKGFTITKVLQDSATLTKKDQELVLRLAKSGALLQAGSLSRKTGEDSWLVSGDKLTDVVSNINQYVGQVVAYQYRENGKPAGFRIRHLKEGNDFEKMGIEDGDIIKNVNGLDINDLSDVLANVYKLSDETSFQMEVIRNNQTTTLNYQLDKSVNPLVPIISNMFKSPMGRKKTGGS
jgi:type II secretion system protein C